MSLSLRLQKRMKELGYTSQREFARAAGIPWKSFRELIAGNRQSSKWLPKISESLSTTIDYLLTGTLTTPSYTVNVPNQNQQGVEFLGPTDKIRLVPVITNWEINYLTRIEDMTESPSNEEKVAVPHNLSDKSKAFRIKDESMVSLFVNAPSFRLGDIIIVDPEKQSDVGSFVIAEIEGKPEFVFRQIIEEAGEKYLASLNPQHGKIRVDEKVKVFGTLIRHQRDYF
jgi:SOS-response transcriptional repressor LexA